MIINFLTLKWGKKYGPEYVNRLYKTLLNIYSGDFDFYCFTDDPSGLESGIKIMDIAMLRPNTGQNKHEQQRCFTAEKIFLFDGKIKGNNVVLDLDILVQKDLYPYFKTYGFSEGRFIQNEWNHIEQSAIATRMGTCCLNSSFITWKDDQLKYVLDFFIEHQKIIEFKYGDLDTFLYQALRKKLNYHPPKMVMSYNYASENTNLDEYPILIFNTSHGKNTGCELHQAADWVVKLWRQYD